MKHTIKPRALRVEASSFCELRCPSCPTTTGAIHPAVGRSFLRVDDFRRPLDAPALGVHCFGHNEHELPAARRLAEQLDMEFCPTLSWDDEFSPLNDKAAVRKNPHKHMIRTYDEQAEELHRFLSGIAAGHRPNDSAEPS